MIDTDKIKNNWNNFEFGLVLDVDESTIFALFHDLKTLMKSHDELERKLKIAYESLAKIRDKTEDNLIAAIADDILNPKAIVFSNDDNALKQIRGDHG